jgi:hypothetical protein
MIISAESALSSHVVVFRALRRFVAKAGCTGSDEIALSALVGFRLDPGALPQAGNEYRALGAKSLLGLGNELEN